MSSTTHFLDLFFYPRNVAVVGASRNQRSNNYYLAENMIRLGFPGTVYPVNPNATEILGRKAYPTIRSIKDDIDLAVISVPARMTLDVVRECVAKKVKGITIVAGGFSEIGTDGRKTQDEILSLLRESGIRAIGPNALSPVNSANSLIIGFMPSTRKLPQGGLSFIFQSGLYQPRLNWLTFDLNLRISKLIDLGNKMDINEVDALEYLAQDEDTRVIALHMESIAGDARRFMQVLRETTPHKPVIVLKSGRTAAGAKAASSHTAAIMKSSDTVVDAALRQAGAIRVQGLDEFFDLAKAFEYLPPLKGNRVAIAAFSGGEGVLTTDAAELNGLTVAMPGAVTRQRLDKISPPWEIPLNPFDTGVTGQFHSGVDVAGEFIRAVANDTAVDCAAIQIGGGPQRTEKTDKTQKDTTPGRNDNFAAPYLDLLSRGKTAVTWTVDPGNKGELLQQLEENGIPVYPSAERAIRALGAVWRYWGVKKSR
jgi:acyl-CoA synthetase (NDP forming)